MFIEPNINNKRRGWIEVICGSMFSGKTEELIRRLKRATIAHQEIRIFKPTVDIRYHRENIVSHDENAVQSTPIEHSSAMFPLADGVDVVAIDEAQFFDSQLPDACEQLALHGIRVIVAGLDMDYSGKPFGPVPDMLARADYITKLHAICVKCGNIANYSYRKSVEDGQILLGEKELYEPRCRDCFYKEEDA